MAVAMAATIAVVTTAATAGAAAAAIAAVAIAAVAIAVAIAAAIAAAIAVAIAAVAVCCGDHCSDCGAAAMGGLIAATLRAAHAQNIRETRMQVGQSGAIVQAPPVAGQREAILRGWDKVAAKAAHVPHQVLAAKAAKVVAATSQQVAPTSRKSTCTDRQSDLLQVAMRPAKKPRRFVRKQRTVCEKAADIERRFAIRNAILVRDSIRNAIHRIDHSNRIGALPSYTVYVRPISRNVDFVKRDR